MLSYNFGRLNFMTLPMLADSSVLVVGFCRNIGGIKNINFFMLYFVMCPLIRNFAEERHRLGNLAQALLRLACTFCKRNNP